MHTYHPKAIFFYFMDQKKQFYYFSDQTAPAISMCGLWEVLSMAYCLQWLNHGMISIYSRECYLRKSLYTLPRVLRDAIPENTV